MVEQLARFLGVSCDKAQLESLTEHCHHLVDQCCNAEALPVGRGTCPCPLGLPSLLLLPPPSAPSGLLGILSPSQHFASLCPLCGQGHSDHLPARTRWPSVPSIQ